MAGELFTVIPVDGEAWDVGDFSTNSLRYDGLSWDEAVDLCRLSFKQGFEVVIWKADGAEGEVGGTS